MMISGSTPTRRLIHCSNSLMNYGAGVTTPNGHYMSKVVQANIGAAGKKQICGHFLSIPGQPTQFWDNDFNTAVLPFLRTNDVIILWGITGDVASQGSTGAQVYSYTQSFCAKAHAVGTKVAVVSFIARDAAGDAADLMTRGEDCNVLLRADNSFCDLFIDVGADPLYNQRADCSDTTYYLSDKLHLTAVSQDYIGGLISTALNSSTLLNW